MRTAIARWPALVLCLCALAVAGDAAAAVRAWLDRDSVVLGETVTLNVEGDSAGVAPDFSVLARDFELLGTSSGTQVQIVNGQRSLVALRAVALRPLRAGTVTIPAFELGGERTEPLTLTVHAPAQAPPDASRDVFLEVEAEPRDPWVQQQVRYTLRLFYAVTLLEGQLDEPVVEHGEVRRLGQDSSDQRIIGGRRYNVVERHYAIIPERSGTLTVQAPGFRGRAILPGRRSTWIGGGAPVAAGGQAVTLEVRPRPDQAPGPWLPAAELSLEDASGSLPEQVVVGEPLTLTLRLRARGLGSAQLPELELGAIEGAEVYPDQAVARDGNDGGWLLGERERKFAVVPGRPGRLELPGMELRWFDTDTRQPRVARIAARTLIVLPGASAASAPAVQAPAASADGPPAAVSAPGPWPAIAIGFALLWLATLGYLAWQRRRVAAAPVRPGAGDPATRPDLREARARLRKALDGGSLPGTAAALRALADAEGLRALSLGELAAQLVPAQRAALDAIENARYGDGDAAVALAAARSAFAAGRLERAATRPRKEEAGPLPPLYPR